MVTLETWLSEIQLDALVETFNLSLGDAAVTFAQLVAAEIEFSLPIVQLVNAGGALTLFEQWELDARTGPLCGVVQHFDAETSFGTDTMLVFPEHGCHALAHRLLQADLPIGEITGGARDALAELGDVVVHSCMASMSQLFKREIVGKVPEVVVGDARTLLTKRASSQHALIARISVAMSDQDVRGYFVFMMDRRSIRHLVADAERLFSL